MPQLRLTRGVVQYDVKRRKRRTVGVVVRPDGRVEVHAPLRASAGEIRGVVEEFRPWIERKRGEALSRLRRRRARRFDDGDPIPYLGGRLQLVVVESARPVVDPVVRDGNRLQVTIPAELSTPSRRAVTRYAVIRWLLEEAREVFHRRHVRAARVVGRSAKRVVIKDMVSRWGSCGPDRVMSLNWRLVLAPMTVVDYVLIHELLHIVEPNHSPAFWRRVGRCCANWEASRDWLRVHGDDLEI